MSRIGRMPVTLPAGVTVDVKENTITVKGPKGTLTQEYDPKITITVEGNAAHLTRADEENDTKAKHGLYRALLHNRSSALPKVSKRAGDRGVGWKVAKAGQ